MCQMRVVAEKEGREEVLLENVTRLEVAGSVVTVTTLFEGSREFAGAALRCIDFLAGKVILELG
jgi:predicted RNA-binding protein